MQTRQQLPTAMQLPNIPYTIRPVLLRDAVALCADCWQDRSEAHATELIRRIQRFAERGRGLGIVVVVPGSVQVVAYGQITLWTRCAEISDLIVSAESRSSGIGTAMIQYLVQAARGIQADCIEIGAAFSNPRALALYRRLGFVDAYQLMLNLGQGNEPVMYLRLDLYCTS